MRTTLNLDDDALTMAKQYARNRSVGLGKAVSDLVRRGINAPRATKIVNGLHVADLPENSPRVTTKKVRELDAEQE